MPPKNQRRSHTKSKAGCSQCKVRRIKCNEQHPVCSNCERRQITCDFSLSPSDSGLGTSDAQASTSSPAKSQFNGSTNGHPPPQQVVVDPFLSPNLISARETTELAVSDLELIHHYTLVVAADLGDNYAGPSHTKLWQEHLPRLAFKHEFLLRGILTLSALNMSYLNPKLKAEYDLKASTHQDIALAKFQETLGYVNESNCHALFAFSCLLVAIAFATSSRDVNSTEAQADMFHWVYLLRGGNSILQLHKDLLQGSFLAPMLDSMAHTETTDPHVIPHADRISELFKLCANMDDPETSQACTLAIHNLLSTFIQASLLRKRGEGFVLASLVWPVHLSPKFLEILSERKAEAMVILAHYCVLMHWGAQADQGNTWFLIGWARTMLDAIKASIADSWHPMLAWPDNVIQ